MRQNKVLLMTISILLVSWLLAISVYAGKDSFETFDYSANGAAKVTLRWNSDDSLNYMEVSEDENVTRKYFKAAVLKDGVLVQEMDPDKQASDGLMYTEGKQVLYSKDRNILKIESYDAQGNLKLVTQHQNQRVKKLSEDTNDDGVFDSWMYFEAGELMRMEFDRNFDGTPDQTQLKGQDF